MLNTFQYKFQLLEWDRKQFVKDIKIFMLSPVPEGANELFSPWKIDDAPLTENPYHYIVIDAKHPKGKECKYGYAPKHKYEGSHFY